MRWPLMVLLVLLTLTLLLTPVDASANIKPHGKSEKAKEEYKRKNKGKSVASKADAKDGKVLESIETNLMSLFGFSKRPRPNKKDIVIPAAMLELYERQTGMEVDTTNFMLPGRLTSSANTVRSFTHEESAVDNQFRMNRRFRLFFPMGNSIPKSERLKAAELHLSRAAASDAGDRCNTLRILVYDIVLPGIKGKRDPVTRLVDTQSLSVREDDTLKLDVTPAVERWLRDPNDNHGLLVVVNVPSGPRTAASDRNETFSGSERFEETDKKCFASASNDIERMEKHVRLKRSAETDRKDWKKVEPVLFAFTDDGKSRRRTAEELANRQKRAIRKHKRKDGRENCRRHELYVDFGEVGWNDWIVAPPGYNAFYCSGDCPFPLSDHLNSTNHAIVQTLVNSAFPNTAPKACCVPTTLIPISMLYVDEENKVVLKTYDDMMVEGCGCR